MRVAAACLVVVMGCVPEMAEQSQTLDLAFPVGGLVRNTAVQAQRPFTTPSCRNVRPRDPQSGRDRGGARPMLEKAYLQQLESGAAIRLLHPFRASSTARSLVDPFDGSALSSAWTQWSGDATGYLVTSGEVRSTNTSAQAWRRLPAAFDDTAPWTFEMDVIRNQQANYYVLWQRDNTSSSFAFSTGYYVRLSYDPNYNITGGVTVILLRSGSVVSSVPFTDIIASGSSVTVRIEVDPGTSVKVYYGGSLKINEAHTTSANKYVGFGFLAQGAFAARYSEFRMYYTATGTAAQEFLLVGVNGDFYVNNAEGGLDAATSVETAPAATDELQACEHLGKIYVVNCAEPQYYNSADNTSKNWADDVTAGSLPASPTIICQWRGRIVLGDGTNVWYMSRIDDPFDWDFGATDLDPARAIAGTSSDSAILGEVITALIPFSNDYLIMGCPDSLWMLVGNPASGGSFVNLSQTIGVVSAQAWCITPDNTLVWLSQYGVYEYAPGGAVQPVSTRVLPRELQNTNPVEVLTLMRFDVYENGVYLYQSRISGGSMQSWFIDWTNRGFWPDDQLASQYATAICAYDSYAASGSKVLIGGADGYVRRHSDSATSDDGQTVTSEVYLGPFMLGSRLYDGSLDQLSAVLADGSGDVDWEVRVGETAEAAIDATARASGTWTAGRNTLERPRIRGAYGVVVLSSDTAWAMEELTAVRTARGRIRQ